MWSKELAELAGVKVSTLRFYEREGLLRSPRRSPGGYREYDEQHLQHVRFLRRGQELGFTLTELNLFVSLSDGAASAAEVTRHAESKILDIEARIADLQRTRDALLEVAHRPGARSEKICPIVRSLGS